MLMKNGDLMCLEDLLDQVWLDDFQVCPASIRLNENPPVNAITGTAGHSPQRGVCLVQSSRADCQVPLPVLADVAVCLLDQIGDPLAAQQ